MPDDYDTDAVFKRLLGEVRQAKTVLTLAQEELCCDERVRGLSLVGGIAALRRQRDDAEAEVEALRRALDRMIKRT